MKKELLNRRQFVTNTSLAGSAVLLSPFLSKASGLFHSSVDDTIKVALVGCGGRGTGAAVQALKARANVKLVAMADAFRDNLDSSLKGIQSEVNDASRIMVGEDQKFTGFDGYKEAIALADVAILATPPGFRPMHFEAAIKAGKHVFMEKPVATDAIGVRKVLEVAEMAKAKKLNVVVGLQRHYQKVYTDMMKMVHGGKVGDILSAQVYWNNDGVWVRPRKSGMTEMEYQMRNWYYFNWLCGDHIVEQHIHNLDVINWAKQAYPIQAQGLGGRQVRTGNEFGEIYDHHYVEYIYADGTVMNSQCRHIKNTWSRVAETMIGTKGKVSFEKGTITTHSGKVLYKHEGKNDPNPYQVEHDVLFDAIAKGEYKFADTENGAKSTMTAILGRMATYSGKMLTWDEALKSNINLQPDAYTWTTRPKVYPNGDGSYPIAMPGESVVV